MTEEGKSEAGIKTKPAAKKCVGGLSGQPKKEREDKNVFGGGTLYSLQQALAGIAPAAL